MLRGKTYRYSIRHFLQKHFRINNHPATYFHITVGNRIHNSIDNQNAQAQSRNLTPRSLRQPQTSPHESRPQGEHADSGEIPAETPILHLRPSRPRRSEQATLGILNTFLVITGISEA